MPEKPNKNVWRTMKTCAMICTPLLSVTLVFAQAPAPAETEVSSETPIVLAQADAGGEANKTEQPNASSTPTASAADPEDMQSSIEYVGADIQDVLRTLARQAGLNIVLSEEVQGKVTISLTDVSYERAISLIADSKGFVVTKEENILKVQTRASVAAEPLQEDIISLDYTTAADVEKAIRPFLTPQRGNVVADTRSNTIIVSDVPARLTQIREMVRRLDAQTPQVMIEARVLETTKNPRQDYGIRWDSLRNYEVAAKNLGYKFNPTSGALGFYPGGNKDTPIKEADIAVLTASDFRVLVSFLNSTGETELLASPRIVTADNTPARINIAQQFPIPQFTFNQQTASLEVSGFEFKDIGVLLTVTPHINKSGFITMVLKPEISSFDPTRLQTFGGAVAAQIPIINTRNLEASVLIKDGHTLALGGLILEDHNRTFTKVPLMGDIPGLGAAFRSKSFEKNKRNLLIFITPTIVGPEGSTGLEDQYSGLKPLADDDFANPSGWRDNAFPKSEQKERAAAAAK
jgi:type IV pilus assembly protein PilQ